MLTDEDGMPLHAPKPLPPSPRELSIKVSRTTQHDCYNLYPGIFWAPERPESKHGPCTHYDDAEYLAALAEWEERQAEFLSDLQENQS
jgi:hypothetical protein